MAQITVNLVSSGRFWVYDHVTLCIQSSYESEVEQTPKTYFFTSEAAFFFGMEKLVQIAVGPVS